MPWKQNRDADMSVGYVGGWCLAYVQNAFKTDHLYPTAMAAWQAEPNKHTDRPPAGKTVPVYLALGNVPAGHVAIALDDGWIASSTLSGTQPKPYFHRNLDDLIAVYGRYNGGATYLGWGEHVGSVRVVEWVADNASDDQIRQAYRDILERAADDGGLAHYRNYPIDFVRQDLLNSVEYKTLLANKAAQAKAAAEAKAKADAAAKAQAEADAKAKADAAARQQAFDAQIEANPTIKNIQNITTQNTVLLNSILAVVQAIQSLLSKIFK